MRLKISLAVAANDPVLLSGAGRPLLPMVSRELLKNFFARGLGDLLILHVSASNVLLGNILFEKDKMILKDHGFAQGVTPEQVAPCLESGAIGALCSLDDRDWESLSVLGIDHCHIEGDLSATRTNLLAHSRNQYGDTLMGFEGSVYRAYKLMLDSNLIPVVVLDMVEVKNGISGLSVCDLRLASVPLSTIHIAYEYQTQFVEKNLTVTVEDCEVDPEEFNELFSTYLKTA
ncbi:MAG: hypothetical protein O7G83_13135 [Proteobacteria bacterium]|nr:hypothetical protein [Pseudomonadota bacterium]